MKYCFYVVWFVVLLAMPAMAGKIKIVADFDSPLTEEGKTTLRINPVQGFYKVRKLEKGSDLKIIYNYSSHHLVIEGLTYDYLKNNRSNGLGVKDQGDAWQFSFETTYTPYTKGMAEQEQSYQHTFCVTIPKGREEDQTIKADLQRILYYDPLDGSAQKWKTFYEAGKDK